MQKRLLIAILLVLLFVSPVRAQSVTTLKSFNVQLWAEHDQPSMLVIYFFEVTDDTLIPARVEVRIPSNANITAVAFEQDGAPLLAEYENLASDDPQWQVISVNVAEPTVYRVEYYQPLERDGNKRSFTFNWSANYPVENFDVEVRVPQDSTGVKTTPAIPLVQDQIFLSGGAMLNSMDEGDNYRLRLEYSRTSDIPSVSPQTGQAVEPLAPIDTDTEGRVTLNNLPYILGGFGALLIVGSLVYFLRGRARPGHKPRQRRPRSQGSASQIYCHECGTRAQDGDRFCRVCGSKLRG